MEKRRRNNYFRTLLKEESIPGFIRKTKSGWKKCKHIFLTQYNKDFMNKKSLLYFCLNDPSILDHYIFQKINNNQNYNPTTDFDYLYNITFYFHNSNVASEYGYAHEATPSNIKRYAYIFSILILFFL